MLTKEKQIIFEEKDFDDLSVINFHLFNDLEGETLRKKTHSLFPKINEILKEEDGFSYWILGGPETIFLFTTCLEEYYSKEFIPLNENSFKRKEFITYEGKVQKWELYNDPLFPKCCMVIGRNKKEEVIEYKKIKLLHFV